ncbi:MAG: hypothetical protein J6S53_02035 [Lentisphaeria bacterium]|nr:hypothetical protein [Lentisphaeria bacterium]
MASFTFSCPHCGQKFEADESWIGQATVCPSCKNEIIVAQDIVYEDEKLVKEENFFYCPYCKKTFDLKFKSNIEEVHCCYCGKNISQPTKNSDEMFQNSSDNKVKYQFEQNIDQYLQNLNDNDLAQPKKDVEIKRKTVETKNSTNKNNESILGGCGCLFIIIVIAVLFGNCGGSANNNIASEDSDLARRKNIAIWIRECDDREWRNPDGDIAIKKAASHFGISIDEARKIALEGIEKRW